MVTMKIGLPLTIVLIAVLCCNAKSDLRRDAVGDTRQLMSVWSFLNFVKGPHKHGGNHGGGESSGSSSSSGGSGSDGDDDDGGSGGYGDDSSGGTYDSGGGTDDASGGNDDGSGSGSGGDGAITSATSESAVGNMSGTTTAMLVAAVAAASVAIGAAVLGRSSPSEKRHNLKGVLAKRMALFGGHAAPSVSKFERPERRKASAASSDAYSYRQHLGEPPENMTATV